MRQGGRGVKTAYKDLKLKLSERTPSKGGSSRAGSTASASTAGYNKHHSAPNSPVFTKRPQSDLITISNSSTHRSKPAKMLQTSNSMINNSNLTNHFNNNLTINNNGSTSNSAAATSTVAQNGNSITKPSIESGISHSISKSPITVSSSPTSSLSSTSEMNILQELQQHALFKLPTVDRSVSPLNFHPFFDCDIVGDFFSIVILFVLIFLFLIFVDNFFFYCFIFDKLSECEAPGFAITIWVMLVLYT